MLFCPASPTKSHSWQTAKKKHFFFCLCAQASGLSLALTRLTYDTRFTTTAETIVVRDSDGIRILSAGGLGSSDEGEGKRGKDGVGAGGVGTSGGETVGTNKGISSSLKATTARRQRQLRRGPERDTSSAREKIEAAAATMAEKQKRETSALFISFIECDKK